MCLLTPKVAKHLARPRYGSVRLHFLFRPYGILRPYYNFHLHFQGFDKYVEIGRVAYIAFGPDKGQVVAIVDVIDQNRVKLFSYSLLLLGSLLVWYSFTAGN